MSENKNPNTLQTSNSAIEAAIPSQFQAALREAGSCLDEGVVLTDFQQEEPFTYSREAFLCSYRRMTGARITDQAERFTVATGPGVVTRVGVLKEQPLFLCELTDRNGGLLAISTMTLTPDSREAFEIKEAEYKARMAQHASERGAGLIGRLLTKKR